MTKYHGEMYTVFEKFLDQKKKRENKKKLFVYVVHEFRLIQVYSVNTRVNPA